MGAREEDKNQSLCDEELESLGFEQNGKVIKIDFDYENLMKWIVFDVNLATFLCNFFLFMHICDVLNHEKPLSKVGVSILVGINTILYFFRKRIPSYVKSIKAAISDDSLIFSRGGLYFHRSTKTVPLQKIINISIRQDCCEGGYHKLKKLSLDTVSGCEATLIGVKNIEYIKELIITKRKNILLNGDDDKLLMTRNQNKNKDNTAQNELLMQLITKMDDISSLLKDIKHELHTQNAENLNGFQVL